MNVGKAIYYLLANNAGVSAITTRIYPEVAPQDAAAPFIVYRVTSVDPDDTHDGPAVIDEVRVEVICVSTSYDQAADLGGVARVALDRVYGTYNTVNVESIQFDDVSIYVRDQPRQYGQELTFIVRVKRDDVQIATGSPIEALNLWRLADVDDEIVNAIDRQALVYDEATSQWIADGVGQVVIPVRNSYRDDALTVGQVVKAVGAQGDRIKVELFDPAVDDSKTLVGVISEQIAGGADGHAQVYGELRNINTDDFEVGDILYPQSNGSLDTTENQYPIGIVTRKQVNTGRLFIRMWAPGKGYHQRYRTEALSEMFVGVGATVELYYTATADGDGYVTQDLTAAVGEGNVEERVLYYKAGAFGDSGTISGYTNAGLATDATYAEMLTAFNNLLKTESAPITIYATRTEVAGRTGLLDDYPGAAAAYSLRLLDSDYTGSAIRVRRASDNAEQDIGFNANGDLDTSALATFCSGTDGFCKVWYDQSGNGLDATQAITGSQPKIYDNSAGVVTKNGKPGLFFNGAEYIDTPDISTTVITSFAVHDNDGNSPVNVNMFRRTDNSFTRDNGTYMLSRISGGTVTTATTSQIDFKSWYVLGDGTYHEASVNDQTPSTGATNAFTSINNRIGLYGSTNYFLGYFYEMVLYDSNQSSNREGVNTNINDYYSIYTP
jgi:hypothetical protein